MPVLYHPNCYYYYYYYYYYYMGISQGLLNTQSIGHLTKYLPGGCIRGF